MKKHIVMVGLVVALAAGGAYGYKHYQRSELIALVTPSVKNASIRVTNASKLETDKTSITFKELFDRMEQDTAEIEKRSIEIQSASNKDNAEIIDPAVAYLKTCQDFSRALAMKYRKKLALSNALDRFKDAHDDMGTSNSYTFEYAKKRSDVALKEVTKAMDEAASAEHDFVVAAKNLKSTRAKASALMPEDALVEVSQLDVVIQAYEKSLEKSSEGKAAS